MSYITIIIRNFLITYLCSYVNTLQSENINGGELTVIQEYPHHVFVALPNKICNGAIISEWNVITAAHCIKTKNDQYEKEMVTILAGVSNYKNNVTFAFHAQVEKVFLSEDIQLKSVRTIYEGDIAVLKLNQMIPLDNVRMKKVTLPDQYVNLNFELYANTEPILTGFGYNEITIRYTENKKIIRKGISTGDLRFSKTRVLSSEECLRTRPVGKVNLEKKLCSQMEQTSSMIPKGACFGDSGGPLVLKDNDEYILIGILSYGLNTCDERILPAMYTRVSYYRSFIDDAIADKLSLMNICYSFMAKTFCKVLQKVLP